MSSEFKAPDPPKRKRGRPSNASKLLEAQRGESSSARRNRNPPQPTKPGRPRKSDVEAEAKRKRTQSSIRESFGSTAGRRVSRGDGEDVDDDEEPQRPGKRSRVSDASRRSSQGAGVIGRRGIPQPNQPGSHGHSRRPAQDDEVDDRAPPPPSPPKPYVHVAPHPRRVRQSSKWTPLTNASLTAVSTTLQYAQRPILQHLSDTTVRRTHASSALRQITRRIARRIAPGTANNPDQAEGYPFPPASMPANVGRAPLQSDGGREIELNFESVLDSKLNLERQLEPALDGLEVLRREKEAMEEELEKDYETLRNLEAGARAQAREQRSLLKKAHVLTPPAKQDDAECNAKDKGDGFVFSRDTATASGGAFTVTRGDKKIHDLVVQLGDYVDSIRANLEQTEGIMPLVARSRATLRTVLLRYLDEKSYERVVLG